MIFNLFCLDHFRYPFLIFTTSNSVPSPRVSEFPEALNFSRAILYPLTATYCREFSRRPSKCIPFKGDVLDYWWPCFLQYAVWLSVLTSEKHCSERQTWRCQHNLFYAFSMGVFSLICCLKGMHYPKGNSVPYNSSVFR